MTFNSPAPQQANSTSTSFVTPGNQSPSDQLPAPVAPEYQDIGALEYRYLQFCAQHTSWTPEELHAHALEQPGADAPARAADLAMWVWQLTAVGQPRLQQQPQSQHQQEPEPQHQQEPQSQQQQEPQSQQQQEPQSQQQQEPQPQQQEQPQLQRQQWSSRDLWPAPAGFTYLPIGSLTFQLLTLDLWEHPDYGASELRCLAGEYVGAAALGRQGDLDWWIYQLTEADDTAFCHMSQSDERSDPQPNPHSDPQPRPQSGPQAELQSEEEEIFDVEELWEFWALRQHSYR